MPIWMFIIEWLARAILILLFILSIWSIQIMIDRHRFFKKLFGELPNPDQLKHLSALPKSTWVNQELDYLQPSKDAAVVERSFENFLVHLKPKLEKGLPVLGSLGATAPFIGLLGTVLGIIKAFGDLAINSQNTNKIMFLLAEALILTGVGLLVAIPAVLAFNYFGKKVRAATQTFTVVKNLYLNQNQN